MSILSYHTERMKSVIRASREIVQLKTILRRTKMVQSDLEQIRFRTKGIQETADDILYEITVLQSYIARRMEIVLEPVLFFDYVLTHFTQQEMDRGYHVIEYAMSDGPMFDDDADFVQVFAKFALILHNGKLIPLTKSNLNIIRREIKPV